MFRLRLGVVLCVATSHLGAADPAAPPPAVVGVVGPAFRDTVAQVVRAPTLSAKGVEVSFPASPAVYDWLVAHPDRTALAWRRTGVPCVPIGDLGGGRFRWTDDKGSEVIWEVVGRFPDGVVWLATGHVKAGNLLPNVPVKAVAILHAQRTKPDSSGAVLLRPAVRVHVQTDSRAAAAVLRVVGPAAPRLAEQGAEQLLLFFSGIAQYLHKNPDEIGTLLAPPAGK